MLVDDTIKATGVAQVLVYLKPADMAAKATTLSQADRRIVPRRTAKKADIPLPLAQGHASDLRSHFRRSVMTQDAALAAAGAATSPVTPVRYYPNLGIMLGNVDQAGLAALRKEPAVEHVDLPPQMSLIRPFKPTMAAAGAQPRITWGIQKLNVEMLWKQGLTGAGVLVGHLDTGVDGNHPTLKGGAIKHFAVFDSTGHEVTPTPPPHDTGDHGTHTAATILGRGVDGKHVGVAPGALLASAIVIEGGEVIARILGGMDWSVGLGIRILNMSLGLRGYWDQFLLLTQTLRQHGVLPVFAVGNEGPGTSRSPGNYAEALSTGAIDKQGNVADYSSSQRFSRPTDPIVPDLVAPGSDTYSAEPNGGYQIMSGTSMATPHVSGLAALLWEAKPDATVDQIEQAIFASCDDTGLSAERGGRGVPDGPRALAALVGPGGVPAPAAAAAPKAGPSSKTKKGAKKASPTAKAKASSKKKPSKKAAKKKAAPKKAVKKKGAPKKAVKKKAASKKAAPKKATKKPVKKKKVAKPARKKASWRK